jgi:hypothetical protein
LKYGVRQYQGRSATKLTKSLEEIRIKIREERCSKLEKAGNAEQVHVVEKKEIVIFVITQP